MLAVHWIGTGTVAYRTRRLHGAWRPWRDADADDRTGAWHDGNLDWTGASGGLQFRVQRHGAAAAVVRGLVARHAAPVRALSQAGTPAIVSRAAWGANEEIVRARPSVAPAVRLAVVHHTAGTNSYTRAQAAAIVRGIEVYHVQGNGWNDIGYNFLVDRFGTVYEGRGGGVERNVIGAHAEGFNTGTTGIALLGNYTSAVPPLAQQNALARLLAWRLDVAHVDPRVDGRLHVGRQREVPRGQGRDAARDLRPSRHGAERMSRQSCVRAAAGARAARRADRACRSCTRRR